MFKVLISAFHLLSIFLGHFRRLFEGADSAFEERERRKERKTASFSCTYHGGFGRLFPQLPTKLGGALAKLFLSD
jgi:hypothetical protein